mgnify:FL=1
MLDKLLKLTKEDIKFQDKKFPSYRETIGGREIVRLEIRGMCEFLGLDLREQLERIRENPILAEGLNRRSLDTPPGVVELDFLDLECVPYWLAGVNPAYIKRLTHDKLAIYHVHRKARSVLYEHFWGDDLVTCWVSSKEVTLLDFLNTKGMRVRYEDDTRVVALSRATAEEYRRRHGQDLMGSYTIEDLSILESAYEKLWPSVITKL